MKGHMEGAGKAEKHDDGTADCPPRDQASRQEIGFGTYWRRGWLVLLMVVLINLVLLLLRSALKPLLQQGPEIFPLLGAAILFLVLPSVAYWLFVSFFGHDAWRFPRRDPRRSPEEGAFASLSEATRLESQGRVAEAMKRYQAIMDQFPGTTAGHDAQKSLESLRARIG